MQSRNNTEQIQTSYDYDRFTHIIGNRKLNHKKVAKIINDIDEGLNLLQYYPILVFAEKGNYPVIDGQHRLEVSKRIGQPVYFIEANQLNLKQIASLNSRQEKWSQSDFLRCWINVGIEDYKTLAQFSKDNCLKLGVAIEFLMTGKITKGTASEKFKDGEFEIHFLNETIELLKASDNLFSRYTFFRDRNLLTAVQQLQNKGLCDFEVLKDKISKNPMMMDSQATPKNYIYNIERIYNYNNKIRQVIF